jgi:hypothetical protein
MPMDEQQEVTYLVGLQTIEEFLAARKQETTTEPHEEVTYLVGLQTGAEFVEQQRQRREQAPAEPERTSE